MNSRIGKQPPGIILWAVIMALGGGLVGAAIATQVTLKEEIGGIIGLIIGAILGFIVGSRVRTAIKVSDGVIARIILVTPQVVLGAIMGR